MKARNRPFAVSQSRRTNPREASDALLGQEKQSAHIIQNDNSFARLSPVHPWLIHLLSSIAVMYHVND